MASADSDSKPETAADQRPPIRVLCVDDSPDVACVMCRLIDSQPDMRCVGCLESADRLMEEVCHLSANVVLLDATMPGKPPMDALRELVAAMPEVRTIVFSGYDDATFTGAAINAGAWGCVSKHDKPDTVLHAVRQAAAGNVWSPRAFRR